MIHTDLPRAVARPAAHASAAGRSPGLELHIVRSGKMITVTPGVAPGAEGHYAVGASGDGLGNWLMTGSAERFTGIAPGSWTLSVSWVGIGGWATQTLTKKISLP